MQRSFKGQTLLPRRTCIAEPAASNDTWNRHGDTGSTIGNIYPSSSGRFAGWEQPRRPRGRCLGQDLWLNRSRGPRLFTTVVARGRDGLRPWSSARGTYTASRENLCGKWDRTVSVHEFIPHKVIHLEEKHVQRLMKKYQESH